MVGLMYIITMGNHGISRLHNEEAIKILILHSI